ncbi:MAG: TetR/AcrR family transcriptional regulator [Candidatus Onthovivens sp.]
MSEVINNKTDASLKLALLDLLKRKDFSEINISEVCSLAKVHRSTFYKHYSSLQKLLETIEDEALVLFENFLSSFNPFSKASAKERLLFMLNYFKENKEFMISLNSISLTPNFFEKISKRPIIQEKLSKLPIVLSLGKGQKNGELFAISGIFIVIKNWISNSFKEDVNDVAESIISCLRY